jgi:hypothetical protein
LSFINISPLVFEKTSDEILITHSWRNIDEKTSGEILIKDKWRNINKRQVMKY